MTVFLFFFCLYFCVTEFGQLMNTTPDCVFRIVNFFNILLYDFISLLNCQPRQKKRQVNKNINKYILFLTTTQIKMIKNTLKESHACICLSFLLYQGHVQA